MAEKKEERKGEVIQLSGTAYIKAGAYMKAQDPEIQKKIDELLAELRKKKAKEDNAS